MIGDEDSVKNKISKFLRLDKIASFKDGMLIGMIVGGIFGAIVLITEVLNGFFRIPTWSLIPYEIREIFLFIFVVDPTYRSRLDLLLPLVLSVITVFAGYFTLRYRDCIACGLMETLGYAGYFLWVYFYYSPTIGDYPWEKYWLYIVLPNTAVFLLSVLLASYVGVFLRSKLRTKSIQAEKVFLKYVSDHDNKIRISECAADLGISVKEVEATLELLTRKGKIRREMAECAHESSKV